MRFVTASFKAFPVTKAEPASLEVGAASLGASSFFSTTGSSGFGASAGFSTGFSAAGARAALG
jgi:hypothetical protein